MTDCLNTLRDVVQYAPRTEPDIISVGTVTGLNEGNDVVSDLICATLGRVTWATNLPDAPFASNPAVDSLFLFTARPFDQDSQLQNNLNRWYDARVGRWLSEDPIGYDANDINLYRCAHNNLLLLTDPVGLYSGITGPCEIKIWLGDTLYSKKSLLNFLNKNRDSGDHPLCPSKYLAVVGCGKFVPSISPDQQIPEYYPPDFLQSSKFIEVANAALKAAKELAEQLCENRKKFCDDGTPERYECGSKNQRCDSVSITVTYDDYVSRFLTKGIAPDGTRVPGVPSPASWELLRRLNNLKRRPETINCLNE